MTADQAYIVIGVDKSSSRSQIEQAYKGKLKGLQLLLRPGQTLAVRKQAQQQVAELAGAWEVLKNRPQQSHSRPPAKSHKQPQQQPMPRFAHPHNRARRQPASGSPPLLSNRAVIMSFVVAASMMLAVIFFCDDNPAAGKSKGTAQLRVLSYPWCNVEVDGKSLGPSGQAKAFEFEQGRHKLTLRRNLRYLTRDINLSAGYLTVVRVQFGKGEIDVGKKRS